ncbi:MAG TPA: pantoate--beta-alanine ligase [Candidatus Angelobacter sp.]|jgi:pantoate--beta-alanine ligase|nr:pantoate--beta-alanine ligase [Candidatus Angelobacter sp.]
MRTISSAAEMTALLKEARRSAKSVGFVPTMGALHAGHLSLVSAGRARTDLLVTSVFVNPTQFGPKEDFSKYPRNLEKDSALLADAGVDYLFAPSTEEMYPKNASTWVVVEGISDKLDGKSRPGHFRGVTTVVSKLFNIIQPDLAFFGQKDAAQVAIITKMVRDLNFDVHIIVCPIVRESDGLAMSSRNAYLNPEQRKQALVLYRSLMRVQLLADRGEKDTHRLIAAAKQVIAEEPAARLDYFEIVNGGTLEPVADISSGALVAVAAYVGQTRLIDNILLF